jgi:hypothetical protein
MDPLELKQLIASDPVAKALADAGDDETCASRCQAIAPPVLVSYRVADINIVGMFDNPADGEAVCQQIESVALTNPIVKRALKWILETSSPGLDLGEPKIRYLLTLPIVNGGIGLTAEQAAPLLKAAERQPTITSAQIAVAWRNS